MGHRLCHTTFLIFALATSLMLAEDNPKDFRGAHWGMTVAEVKATESGKPADEHEKGSKQLVSYSDTVAGLSCKVLYIFADHKLVRSKYIVSTEHSNKTDFLSDYSTFLGALTDKYGKPSDEKTIWKNDLYRDKPQDWGMAVAAGHMVKFAHWDMPRTTISLLLKGDNYDITLGVEYSSKELGSLEDEVDKRDEKEKL